MSDRRWRPGARNLITDVAGIKVGNAADARLKSGVTVLTAENGFRASVDVMGGAPGTRDVELLAPDKTVDSIDALVLGGGSAFGLAAATGVSEALRQQGRGFKLGPANVPIVPAAILFDLLNGGDKQWVENPYPVLGEAALAAASEHFDIGTAGAGCGATTGDLKGGLGSASLVLANGVTVGALVAVNAHGSVVVPGSSRGQFWAAAFEYEDEFGAQGMASAHDAALLPVNHKLAAFEAQQQASSNTTIAIVATDARLDKAALKRLAVAAQDGMARAIVPSHTPFDGDLVFSVSKGDQTLSRAEDLVDLGHAASICLARAIARGVFAAQAADGDTLPSWREQFASTP